MPGLTYNKLSVTVTQPQPRQWDEAGAGGQGTCHRLTLTFVIGNTGPGCDGGKRLTARSPQLGFEDRVAVLYLDIL